MCSNRPTLLGRTLGADRPMYKSIDSCELVAGVCTLCWLTARLWGGAPLQLGAAANAVCAAGQALLAALAFALVLALRGRAREHKTVRQEHVRERAREVRHTLVLLVTTCATQAAGVAYVQPGETRMSHVVVLAAAALTNVSYYPMVLILSVINNWIRPQSSVACPGYCDAGVLRNHG